MDLSGWIALVIAVVGWGGTVVLFIYARGKDRGQLEAKITNLQESFETDKIEKEELIANIRKEFEKVLRKIDSSFMDSDGNPRFLSVPSHRDWCGMAQKICGERFDHINDALQKLHVTRDARDNEMFNRLRQLETIPIQIESLKISLKEFTDSANSRFEHAEDGVEKLSGRLTAHIVDAHGSTRRMYD